MRVVPRIIITIRPGMQKCIPGFFCANQQSQRGAGRSAMGSMEAENGDCMASNANSGSKLPESADSK